MEIDIHIAHDMDQGRLGETYNRLMGQSSTDWVLFIDSDVLLLHPRWFNIFVRTIYLHGEGTGLITCKTNRLGCKEQMILGNDNNHDIIKHTEHAISVERQFRGQVEDYTHGKRMSGHVMLVNKCAWEKVGGFPIGGVIGTDTKFHGRIEHGGFKVLCMKDQYVYHRYLRQWRMQEYNDGEWAKRRWAK